MKPFVLDWQFIISWCKIVLLDLTLAGDNAVVIAMAVRTLPSSQQRTGIFFGTVGAVIVRVILTFAAAQLLFVPSLQFLGGVLLIWIAFKLLAQDNGEKPALQDSATLLKAIRVIIIADLIMEFFGNFGTEKIWTVHHWTAVFTDPVFLRALRNTLVLGLGAGVVGTLLYSLISYIIVRTRMAGRSVVDILSWLPWALPGVLISLALLWAVLGSGEYVKLLYGTVALLVLAIIIKEMPLGTQIIKASTLQISNELEEASSTAGASRLIGFLRIMLPLLRPSMVAVGIIVFISAARDIPTVIFLATNQSRTLSLLMLDYIADANQEKAAVLGVFLVLLIFALLFIGWLLGLRRSVVRS